MIEKIKAELIRSNADRRHPFRYFYLATFGDYPEVRTVVKRNFTPDWRILFFTDTRTPKVHEIRRKERVSALFYHPGKQLQLRLKGTASPIHPEHEHYERYLDEVRQSASQKDYSTVLAPGTPVLDPSEVNHGERLYFLPVVIRALELDVVQLSKKGHQRRAYFLKGDSWEEVVLVP